MTEELSFDDKEYDLLRNQAVLDFGYECCNDPSGLYNNLTDYKNNIDEPITELRSILVKDDRASSGYYWSNLTPEEKSEYINYTPIICKNDEVMSMRKIINTLQKDPHYHKEAVMNDNHNFIEGYEWLTPCVLNFYYGS
jgi:hypothetical protein